MNHQQQSFDSLIEYIDARIDQKISAWHCSDEDTAFALKVHSDCAKEELRQALDELSTTLFFGQPHKTSTPPGNAMSNKRPPLWEAMYREDAYYITAHEYQENIAPVIRAVRDWLVPEETFNGGGPPPLPDSDPSFIRWSKERQIRLLLTEEADRAERGE